MRNDTAPPKTRSKAAKAGGATPSAPVPAPSTALSAAAVERPPRVRRGNAEDAAQMRRALTEAALALFLEGGMAAVSMRAVSSRVGLSPMATYRHFPDKAALLAGLWSSIVSGLDASLRTAIAAQPDAHARFTALLGGFIDYFRAHPQQWWLVYETQGGGHASERPGPQQDAAYVGIMRLFMQCIIDLAQAVGGQPARAKRTLDIVFIMLLGYTQALFVNKRYPWDDLQDVQATLLRRAHDVAVLELQGR